MSKNALKYIGIALVILIAVVSYNANDGRDQNKETLKIGVVLPLTGGAGFLGESAQKAAQLALKDAGETKYNYQLVTEDDAFTPGKTVTAVNKLINIDKVSALITFGSGTSNAVAPINETAKVARFGLASDPTSAIGEYNYIHWTPAYKEGELMSQEIVKRGYKRVAIVDTNHPGAFAVTEALKNDLAKTDVQIVSYDVVNMEDRDFRMLMTKIKNTNPDLIVLEAFSPQIELLAKQAREIGIKDIPLTSVEAIEWSGEPELFEGMWFVSDGIHKEFSEHFFAEYGVYPNGGSAYVYDLVSMLIKIQENEKDLINPAELPSLIAEMGIHESKFLGNVEIDKDGMFVTEASVKKIENRKVVEI